MERFIIGRPINGIALNGLEYLLDESGNEMEFNSIDEAKQFLRDNGYDDYSDEDLSEMFTFMNTVTGELH